MSSAITSKFTFPWHVSVAGKSGLFSLHHWQRWLSLLSPITSVSSPLWIDLGPCFDLLQHPPYSQLKIHKAWHNAVQVRIKIQVWQGPMVLCAALGKFVEFSHQSSVSVSVVKQVIQQFPTKIQQKYKNSQVNNELSIQILRCF